MVSLDRFNVFRAVVEMGSFTAAAAALNQARAAVSFNIKQLEAELGVTLLTRTTRRVGLTDAGERFYKRCLRVLDEADGAIEEARGEHGGMNGSLRVTSTVEYGTQVIAPALVAFNRLYPTLQVRLETHSERVDLMRDRFDVAVRLGRLEQFQDLPYRGVCLGTYELRPVAAPALLAGASRIESPDALTRLPRLVHARMEQITAWTLVDRDDKPHVYRPTSRPAVVTDNASVLRVLAREGHGVALLPDWLVRDDLASGALVDTLPDFHFPQHGVYALYLPTRHVSHKVRAWVDFMKRYCRDASA